MATTAMQQAIAAMDQLIASMNGFGHGVNDGFVDKDAKLFSVNQLVTLNATAINNHNTSANPHGATTTGLKILRAAGVRAAANAAGAQSVAVGSKNVTGGTVNLTADDVAYGVLEVTGALTSDCILVIPAGTTGRWCIRNGTTGLFGLFIRPGPTGSNSQIPQGSSREFYYSSGPVLREATDTTAALARADAAYALASNWTRMTFEF